jgi:ferredoxin
MTWMVDSFSELAEFLRTRATVQGPVGEERIVFEELSDGRAPNVSRRSDVSARHALQPMTHYYMRFSDGPDPETSFEDYDSNPRVLLGVRPCDVRGLSVHDKIFGESESYRRLRNSTAFVGLLCPGREPTCFCDSMGGDPLSREGMDVVTYGVDGGYVIEALTEKGRALMDGAPFRRIESVPEPTFEEVEHPSLDTEGLADAMGRLEESPAWSDVAFPCVGCRVCTYVCPTCHCFTVTDEVFGRAGGRAAVWDSCQNRSFTKEASGHNPRALKPARVRQRILHKFSYYPTTHGDLMCSGCGRCISACPTGRNIVEELTLLKGVAADD